MGLELSSTQFEICQQANGQFCHISTPFQPLANPPTCIATLYAKSEASITSKWLLAAMQSNNHLSSYTDHSRCLDTHHPSYSSYGHHKSNMPRETHGNNPNLTATTCTATTNGLQCHFSSFLPTTKV